MILLGAYGTGTNWARATFRKSGITLYEKAGVDPETGELVRHFFKHYVIEADTLSILKPPENAVFVCLVKSPLFWFISLSRMLAAGLMAGPMHRLKGLPMAELIRSPGKMVSARRELGGAAFVQTVDLPELWNQYALGYLHHLPSDRAHFVPYELAVRDPAGMFHAIMDRVGGDRSSLQLHTERRMDTGHGLSDAQAYYGDDRNRRAPFSDRDIAFVENRIDRRLLTELGYRVDGGI